jgi:phage gp45-like
MNTRGYHPHLVRSEFIKTDDSDGFQLVDLYGLAGEQLKQVYRPQPYGLSTYAPNGSHGVMVSFGGERTASFLVGGDLPAKRPNKLNEGDVKLYDQSGNIIYLAQKNGIQTTVAGGDYVVTAKNGKITLTASGHNIADPGGNNVYLGMSGPGGARVATEAGLSKNVYAAV